MKIKEFALEIALDLFQSCDFLEELVKFLMQRLHVLNDDAVGGKPFQISESYLTISEVSMREQGQRSLQAREKSRRPLAD